MSNLVKKNEELEQRIEKIEERNRKVELNKKWETSTFRKVSIAILTYIFMVVVMYFLGAEHMFLDALIPTFGYILSTLGMNALKKIYMHKLK